MRAIVTIVLDGEPGEIKDLARALTAYFSKVQALVEIYVPQEERLAE